MHRIHKVKINGAINQKCFANPVALHYSHIIEVIKLLFYGFCVKGLSFSSYYVSSPKFNNTTLILICKWDKWDSGCHAISE